MHYSGEEEDSIVGRSSDRQSCHHLINSHTSDSSPLNNNEKRDGAWRCIIIVPPTIVLCWLEWLVGWWVLAGLIWSSSEEMGVRLYSEFKGCIFDRKIFLWSVLFYFPKKVWIYTHGIRDAWGRGRYTYTNTPLLAPSHTICTCNYKSDDSFWQLIFETCLSSLFCCSSIAL